MHCHAARDHHHRRRAHDRARPHHRGPRLPEPLGGDPRPRARRHPAGGGNASTSKRDCVAALVYVYDHNARQLSKRLADTFHDHHELSLASMHAHLDHDNCMEVTILRGKTDQVQHFAEHVIAERGVRHGRIVLVPTDVMIKPHTHADGTTHGHSAPPPAFRQETPPRRVAIASSGVERQPAKCPCGAQRPLIFRFWTKRLTHECKETTMRKLLSGLTFAAMTARSGGGSRPSRSRWRTQRVHPRLPASDRPASTISWRW